MKSFALIKRDSAELVIIGGRQKHIRHHKHKAKHLKIHSNTHFLGSRPLADLSIYLKQADILASPRIKGENTSMKVYSYLHSGKVVIATNLPTNTQAMDSNTAQLTKPDKKDFAEKLEELIFNPELRTKLGNNARKLAKEKYTLKTYKKTLLDFYYKDMPKIS